MTDTALHLQRFNDDIADELTFPLKEVPQRSSNLHSPLVGNHHGIKPFDFTKYEEYLEEVLHVRLLVSKGIYPQEFIDKHYPWGRTPAKWPEFLTLAGITREDVDSCTQAVRMDTSGDLGIFIQRWLLSKNRLEPKVSSNHFDFLGKMPGAQKGLTDAVHAALTKCFEHKWYHGVARPSQIYNFLYGRDGSEIEAYPHPTHPSYAAGHSAAAAATAKYFYDNFNLDTQDWIDIRYGAYLFGQFRTFAGVHYAVDNLAGLEIGGLDVGYKVKEP